MIQNHLSILTVKDTWRFAYQFDQLHKLFNYFSIPKKEASWKWMIKMKKNYPFFKKFESNISRTIDIFTNKLNRVGVEENISSDNVHLISGILEIKISVLVQIMTDYPFLFVAMDMVISFHWVYSSLQKYIITLEILEKRT